MERIFALYDSDIFYATRFMEYYKKKQDFGFEVVIFTCKECLDEFLRLRFIEILLLGEGVVSGEISSDRVGHIYQLTDESGNEPNSGFTGIIKYQPVQSVVSDILSDYRRRKDKSAIASNPQQAKLVCIFSPAAAPEALSFAWSAGLMLANHKKVLLVLLELLPVQLLSSVDYSSQALSEFIYYLRENPDIITKMNTILGYQGNLSYLAGAANGADILALTREDIQKWVHGLKTKTDCQEIIFYIGFYSEAVVELMKLSDSVLIAAKNTSFDNAVFMEFTRQLKQTGVDVSPDKFIKLELPDENTAKQLPLSLPELKETASWKLAEQSSNLF